LTPRLRSGQDFELGGDFGCLREAVWRIWVRKKSPATRFRGYGAGASQSKTQVFAPNTQVLRQNVRKRSKTFENIRKRSKSSVKRLKSSVKRLKIFENIRLFLARFFATKTPSHEEKLAADFGSLLDAGCSWLVSGNW